MITLLIGGGSIEPGFLKNQLELAQAKKGANTKPYSIIAVDKGLEACLSLGIEPDHIIGDFDSLAPEHSQSLAKYAKRLTRLNPIKDDTDMEAALAWAFANTEGPIYILGGTGTRIDHMVSNISLLGQGFAHQREILLLDPNNRIRLVLAEGTKVELSLSKEEQFGKYVSLFPWAGPVIGLSLEGFKYPLNEATLCGFNSLGVSNEIIAQSGRISFTEGNLLVIESTD